MSRSWDAITIRQKKDRAAARAVIAIGVNVSSDTKRITHRVSGTLARSIHVAVVGYEQGERDAVEAPSADLLLSSLPGVAETNTSIGAAVEVGSWMPYACVEWVGRQHPGITQGLEMNRGARADAIVQQAFFEEGL